MNHQKTNAPPAIITRFAPSPTGRLHLGHAFSAGYGFLKAQKAGGRFILRIEDIDPQRCHQKFEDGFYEDLRWLGITWEGDVRRQSDHMDDYARALETLQNKGLLYPCFCSRKDILNKTGDDINSMEGPEGPLYPGTCRKLSTEQSTELIKAGKPYALRLKMDKAVQSISKTLYWVDVTKGEIEATPQIFGDVVLARKDTPVSYHLCVTIDDHLQNITHVTRGIDLFFASHIHRLLQELLALDVPVWDHHGLLLDKRERKFSKSDQSVTIQSYREESGLSPRDVLIMAGITDPNDIALFNL
jgi:glutamyl-Q tRNA(Asp) synthetase